MDGWCIVRLSVCVCVDDRRAQCGSDLDTFAKEAAAKGTEIPFNVSPNPITRYVICGQTDSECACVCTMMMVMMMMMVMRMRTLYKRIRLCWVRVRKSPLLLDVPVNSVNITSYVTYAYKYKASEIR